MKIFFIQIKLLISSLIFMLLFAAIKDLIDYITIYYIEDIIGFYPAYFSSNLLLVGIVCAIYHFYSKKFKRKENYYKQFEIFPILIIIIIVFLIVTTPFYQFENIVTGLPINQTKEIEVFSFISFASLLRLSFTGPIIEELIFRGIILNYLLQKDRIFFSLIISSVLFVLFHFDYFTFEFDLRHSFVLFVLSIVLGIIYYKTKNVLYPIIGHIVYNTSIALVINRNFFINFINFLGFGIWYWIMIISSLVLFLYLLIYFYRKEHF